MEQQYKIPEDVGNPYPLGRHVAHDELSRNYPVRALFDAAPVEIKSVRWKRLVPIYNQGELGSCTLNAALGCVSTRPFNRHFRSQRVIQRYYSETTKIDPFDGSWPPDDTGSDGNSAAKTLRNHKIISEWRHCFSFTDVQKALQLGPIITGTNWYEGMFRPSADGQVRIGGSVAGGHEWCIVGLDVEKRLVLAANSWGFGWANHGYFTIGWDDYNRLLHEDGDATVLIK